MLDPVSWLSADGKIHRSYAPALENQDGKLRLLDQTLLPVTLKYIELNDTESIFSAIKNLTVRGAPAIGCAAALGLAAIVRAATFGSAAELLTFARGTAARLAESRPTAVNLFWALDRCLRQLETQTAITPGEQKNILLKTALDILAEDIDMCRAIGEHGKFLLHDGMGILTHCNAGALATGDYGTALAPVYVAHEAGMALTVYSDETRPLLQGSRLTAWELDRAGVKVVSICDNMAAQVMKEGKIDLVIVGADRIAANGDAANKIGTYGIAVLAKYHKVPFYVAAPYSSFDLKLKTGGDIPIEQRPGDEIANKFGCRTAPENIEFYNPAFDVTPHSLISGIITEKGIITAPFSPGKIAARLRLTISGTCRELRQGLF
ncbi:MAG: S-methyl-5-thioribose-1-phosphate isomerase [Victivallales bacterium]|nr:S-methyl-5-thioribose-1-phosphate isomerase [Victivallales bacterium]